AGIQPQALEKAIYEELEKLKAQPVDAHELEKAKNILTAEFYRRMKTISGQAHALGSYEVYFGDYRKLASAADEMGKVTTQDVQRVARSYFGETNRTVATLVPEEPTK